MGRENTRCTFFIRQSSRFRRQPANTSRRPSFHTSHTILRQPTSFLPSWPADALHISNLHIQPHHLNFLLPFFYRQHPSGYFHHSSIFPFPIFNSNFLPSPISNSTSSVLLPLLQPAGQTRNVVSRAGAACKAADGAGEEPAFLFFSFFFYFFLLLSFLSPFSSHWRRGFAATPSFFFLFFLFIFFFLFAFVLIFVLIFVFFLFAFLFAFSFCFFSLYFYSDFLFLFFCPFFLLFLSFYFCSYLCFFCFLFLFLLLSLLSLFFLFVFLLSFYPCFSFPFLSFFLFYFFTLLTPISFLIIQPLADHSFFLFRRQSFPFHPAASGSSKKEKKYRQKNPRGLNGLPGANGQRNERQRDGMG